MVLRVRLDDGSVVTSRDISAVGIFLETGRVPAGREPVRLTVDLGEWDAGGGFRIHGEGRLVRVDTSGSRRGIALDVVWSDVEPLRALPGDERPTSPG